MTNQCLNCGGNLRYDIPTGQLKCDHCDSVYPVEGYQGKTGAEYHGPTEDYEVTVYTCPNCGAEISSTENAALDYCLYCGSFVTLDQQLAGIRRPDDIIPFRVTKEECKASYRKMIGRKLYAPKEFRKDEFLENFRGIYIPYWDYSYDAGPEFRLNGEEEDHRKGDYVYMQKYDLDCRGSVHLEGVEYDASSTFDDGISGQITQINRENVRPFHPGYMFGFFGDTADVEAEVYRTDADTLAETVLWDALKDRQELKDGHLVKPGEERTGHPEDKKDDKHKKNAETKADEAVRADEAVKPGEAVKPDEALKPGESPNQSDAETSGKKSTLVETLNLRPQVRLTMLPVWFLTWRKGNQVAYSVVNGDTGEICSEVPVDTKRYLAISLLTAVPIYILLNSMITFNGTSLLLLTMFLSCVFQIIYATEVERITRRILHIDDKGYLARHREAKEKSQGYSENFLTGIFRGIFEFLFEDGILGFMVSVVVLAALFGFVSIGIVVIVIVAPFYSIYRIRKNSRMLQEPGLVRDIIIDVAALIISILVLFSDPASDYFYYGAALICLLAIAFSTVRIMIRYNEVITRPVPHFFDRKEGGAE